MRIRTAVATASVLSSIGLALPVLASAAVSNERHAATLTAESGLTGFGDDAIGHSWAPVTTVATTATTVATTTSTLPPTTTSTVAPATTSTTVAPATTSTTAAPTTSTTVAATTSTTADPTTSTTAPSINTGGPIVLPPGDLFGTFDTPLSPTAPVSPSSSALAADIVNQYHAYYGTFGVVQQYPVVTVSAGQALVPVSSAPGCNNFQADTGDVPIPASAASLLPGTGDNPLLVWQPSTSSEWEFWQMSYSGGQWSACWGGKISNVATSGGLFTYPYGLAASGFSYLATIITEADVQSGSIDHPLALQIPLCSSPQVSPATRNDCGNNPGTPAEGMLFRLPAGLAMPSGLTPFGQMVFRALQSYGAYVTDHAGAVVIAAEDPNDWTAEGHTGTDPITASWDGQPQYWAMNGIPWSDLQQVES